VNIFGEAERKAFRQEVCDIVGCEPQQLSRDAVLAV
jgi:hypothetical protein